MNPETAVALESLRGLHLPSGSTSALQGEVALAVLLGFAAALLTGLARILRARRHASIRRAALRELARAETLDPQSRRVAQARLLRRVMRTLQGDEAASQHGAAWASALDRTFATDFFSRGRGRILIDGLYRRPDPGDAAALEDGLKGLFARIKA